MTQDRATNREFLTKEEYGTDQHLAARVRTHNPYLPKELTWRTLMEQLECQIKESLAGAGSYRVPKTTGVFIARRELGLGK